MQQRTLKKAVECSGIGLHSGTQASMILRPAPEDTGILFAVKGQDGRAALLGLKPEAVVSTGLATTIGNGKDVVSTVEHLLAAARGLEIDNLLVEVDGREIPIMDGSAAPFVYLMRLAGVRRQSRPRRVLMLKKPVEFERDGKYIKAKPYEGLAVDCSIDFNHPLVGRQRFRYVQNPASFIRHIAKARTFGFLREVEMLRQRGLALGGSLENAVVLDEKGVLNPEGLRFEDEFVRHKVLDFLGDLTMFGETILGDFAIHASGHALNNEFLRFLAANREEYLEPVDLADAEVQTAPYAGDSKRAAISATA